MISTTTTELLQLANVIGWVLLIFVLRNTLLSYISEKGKNLATKEDVEEITRKVEGVKAQINLSMEASRLVLSKDLHTFSTQFSRLDDQRASGIMEIFGLMCDIEQLLIWRSGSGATALISSAPEARTMDALNQAWERVPKLSRILNYHSLLLDEQVYTLIREWSTEVLTVISAAGKEIEPLRKQAAQVQAPLTEREAALAAVMGKHLDVSIPRLGKIKRDVATAFREILTAKAEA